MMMTTTPGVQARPPQYVPSSAPQLAPEEGRRGWMLAGESPIAFPLFLRCDPWTTNKLLLSGPSAFGLIEGSSMKIDSRIANSKQQLVRRRHSLQQPPMI
jgi:hypothetical protein